MHGPGSTRRSFLRGTAAAVAVAAVPTVGQARPSHWDVVETPTGNTLYDVEYTSEGAFTVGAGGVVLERTDEGWQKVLDGGPTGNGTSLYGSAVTGAGGSLWFVGASGAIGEYDLGEGVVNDYSAPNDVTNNFNDVAVTAWSSALAGPSSSGNHRTRSGPLWPSIPATRGTVFHGVRVCTH